MTKRTFLLFGLLLLPCILKADHPPDRETAKGKSDTVLSGVDVYVSTIAAVEKWMGKPARIEDLPERDNIAGGRNYEWRRPGVRLVLGTWDDQGPHSIAYSVEVWGAKPDGIIGTTGKGLRLGSKLASVRRIYGSRVRRLKRDDGTLQVTIQWRDETRLDLYFDWQGRVNHMHLLASTE